MVVKRLFLYALAFTVSLSNGFVVTNHKSGKYVTELEASIFGEPKQSREERIHLALVDAVVQPDQSLKEVFLVGKTDLPSSRKNNSVPCLVLATSSHVGTQRCLMLPSTPEQIKLLSFVVQDKPLSKSVLLTLNPLLVNRDDALFDNLPWATWTIDPQKRNRDAAGNNILPKFHFGKRDAYQRFGGKDWKGRSLSIGNMAMRLKAMIETGKHDSDGASVLTKRILTIQISELREELFDWDYKMVVARRSAPEKLDELRSARTNCAFRLQDAEDSMEYLTEKDTKKSQGIVEVLERIAGATTNDGQNAAPYRGATGYAPMLDTAKDLEASTLPFKSPFGLMVEILEDQLNAKVIGSLLENMSLLEGNMAVGGAIILQRIVPKTSVVLEGKEYFAGDQDEELGNKGIRGGQTILVECDIDEAIGMAMTVGVPILAESGILNQASLEGAPIKKQEKSNSVYDVIPRWEPLNKDLSFLVEGQATNQSVTQDASPIRIPRTTMSLFDSIFDDNTMSMGSSLLFPDDNPVQSLSEFDRLSNGGKAKMLMSLSNFDGKLPRRRVLRTWDSNGNTTNPLDQLLLPLIDESVRRQYYIRDAQRRGDTDTVRQLEASKSKRQEAKEMAELARQTGDDKEAAEWEDKAKFYESLRADVTQDEGSYNRFLDRDDWYQEQREQMAKRMKKNKKKMFGSLLRYLKDD